MVRRWRRNDSRGNLLRRAGLATFRLLFRSSRLFLVLKFHLVHRFDSTDTNFNHQKWLLFYINVIVCELVLVESLRVPPTLNLITPEVPSVTVGKRYEPIENLVKFFMKLFEKMGRHRLIDQTVEAAQLFIYLLLLGESF